MERRGRHLDCGERAVIFAEHRRGASQREIARLWDCDERTVKREMAKLRAMGAKCVQVFECHPETYVDEMGCSIRWPKAAEAAKLVWESNLPGDQILLVNMPGAYNSATTRGLAAALAAGALFVLGLNEPASLQPFEVAIDPLQRIEGEREPRLQAQRFLVVRAGLEQLAAVLRV